MSVERIGRSAAERSEVGCSALLGGQVLTMETLPIGSPVTKFLRPVESHL